MVLIKTRFFKTLFQLKLVLFIVMFTFKNMRFLKMVKANLERPKKLKVYLYLRYRRKR